MIPVAPRGPDHTSGFRIARSPGSLAVLGVLLLLVAVPVGFLALSSVKPDGLPATDGWTVAHFGEAYGDPGFLRLLINTVAFSVGATLVAVVCAAVLVVLLERTDVIGRRLLRWGVLLPMAAPPMLLAASWSLLLSPRSGALNLWIQAGLGLERPPFDVYTLPGMIFVEGLVLVPTAYLMLMPAARALDPNLEDAAAVAGGGFFQVLGRVTLPLLVPSLLATAAFVAIAGFVVFDIPGVLGLPARMTIFSTHIFLLLSESPTGLPRYGAVSALSMLFLLIMALLAFAYRQLTVAADRFQVVSGRSGTRRLMPLGRRRVLVSLVPWAYVLLAGALPLLVLALTSVLPYAMAPGAEALRSLTWANHTALLGNPDVARAALNTLLVATSAATGVAALAGAAAWYGGDRGAHSGSRAIDVLSFAPAAIPGVLLGVALLYVYLSLPWMPGFGSVGILVVAYVTMYLAYGSRAMSGVLIQLHGELMDAAASCGAGARLALRRIVFPIALPGLVAVWAWVFIHACRELSAALMLRTQGNVVLTTLLWDYWSGGEAGSAAALGLWLVLGMALVISIWRFRLWVR